MGWLFSARWGTRQQLLAHLRDPSRFSTGVELLHSRVSGNRHWYVVQVNRPEGPQKMIGLDLMRSEMAGGVREYGYKDLTEFDGPYYWDCPISYLDLADPVEPGSTAADWRDQVRKFHAGRKEKARVKAGDVVAYGGVHYLLIAPAGPRRGWIVSAQPGGARLRMKDRQLADATPVAV